MDVALLEGESDNELLELHFPASCLQSGGDPFPRLLQLGQPLLVHLHLCSVARNRSCSGPGSTRNSTGFRGNGDVVRQDFLPLLERGNLVV